MKDLKIAFNPSEGYKDSLRKKSGNIMKFIVVAKFSTVPLNAEIISPIILDNNPTMIREIKNNGLYIIVMSRKPNNRAIIEKINIWIIAIKAADTIFAIKIMIKGEGDRYSNLINPNSLS